MLSLWNRVLSRRDFMKIAQRFNAGFVSAIIPVSKGRMKNAPINLISTVPSGLDHFSGSNPALKRPGYCRLSLWDKRVQLTLKSQTALQMSLYPNPAKGSVMVQVAGSLEPIVVIVRDMAGKQVLIRNSEQQSMELKIENLESGYYSVEITSGKAMLRKMLVVF